MHKETVNYYCHETLLKGYLVYDKSIEFKRPAVIVAHAWRGQDDFARQKATILAEMGYVGFAADLYGNGISVTTNEEAQALMSPLFLDRKLLRERITAAFEVIKAYPFVDPSSIGAIGFCFGGLTVMELLRSGADIAGAVGFHGTYGRSLGEHKAILTPIMDNIQGSLLLLHGYDDPFVSQEDMHHTLKELTTAGVDWQMNLYGHAMHAFTNPDVHDPKAGMLFDPKANFRSWKAMTDFFSEVFNVG